MDAQTCPSASQAVFKGPRSLLWPGAAILDGTCKNLYPTGSSVPDHMVSFGATLPAGDTGSCLLTSVVITTRDTPVIEWVGARRAGLPLQSTQGSPPTGTHPAQVSVVLRQRHGFQGACDSLPFPRDPVLHLRGFGHGTSLLWVCLLSLS